MIDKNKVLEIVKLKGPVLPRDIVKEVGGDTFLIGALLSQLVDNKEIKISNAKIGSSPLYYFRGQEQKLSRLYNHLHEKEQRAYDLLKDKKIIRDNEADSLLKVLLRHIRDFAKPLEVNIRGEREIFWKWYLLSNNEAEPIIKNIVSKSLPKEELKKEELEEKREPQKNNEKRQEQRKDYKKEKQEKLEEKQKKDSNKEGDLLNQIFELFEDKGIEIIEHEVIRKNSDIELIVKIPSEVGKLKYFCKVKNKKKTNDKDLSSFFIDAQMKKLPMLYVTTGELTNKAKDRLKEEFTTITVMYL